MCLFCRTRGCRTDCDRRTKIVPKTKGVDDSNTFVAFAVVECDSELCNNEKEIETKNRKQEKKKNMSATRCAS